MAGILRIDASSRLGVDPSGGEGTYSREFAHLIMSELEAKHPNADVVLRDLAADPAPHISDATIKGFYTLPDALTDQLRDALAFSDQVIVKVKAADAIVISAPIYSFSVPSALKAWIDHVSRVGRTYTYEDGRFRGHLEDRPVYLALAYGASGYGEGGPLQSCDQMTPYLMMALNFMRLASITAINVAAAPAEVVTIAAEQHKAFAATATAAIAA